MKIWIKLIIVIPLLIIGAIFVFPSKLYVSFKGERYYENEYGYKSDSDRQITVEMIEERIMIKIAGDINVITIIHEENGLIYRISDGTTSKEFSESDNLTDEPLAPYVELGKDIYLMTNFFNEDFTPAFYIMFSILLVLGVVLNHFSVKKQKTKVEPFKLLGQIVSFFLIVFSLFVIMLLVLV
ncbi:hypothetical protein [Acholeplasma hippikon]|uniref:Uncharacterized protein n=1 Tax=Acholeplasma hippikon TaxID=264636 RepID=A0A449BID1_9MOLU|nr:hypothetical protein [Acholeplasma hippikon]VEU82216.1 Uncharacterised protein [Acholeplasma hippikon]